MSILAYSYVILWYNLNDKSLVNLNNLIYENLRALTLSNNNRLTKEGIAHLNSWKLKSLRRILISSNCIKFEDLTDLNESHLIKLIRRNFEKKLSI